MKISLDNLTEHAIEQMTRRRIPEWVMDALESYGDSIKCRDDGRKWGFSKESRRLVRRYLGKSALEGLSKYRNVYAVICNEKVVTVARSRTPIINRDKFYSH